MWGSHRDFGSPFLSREILSKLVLGRSFVDHTLSPVQDLVFSLDVGDTYFASRDRSALTLERDTFGGPGTIRATGVGVDPIVLGDSVFWGLLCKRCYNFPTSGFQWCYGLNGNTTLWGSTNGFSTFGIRGAFGVNNYGGFGA